METPKSSPDQVRKVSMNTELGRFFRDGLGEVTVVFPPPKEDGTVRRPMAIDRDIDAYDYLTDEELKSIEEEQ